jgi:hypothetical protein
MNALLAKRMIFLLCGSSCSGRRQSDSALTYAPLIVMSSNGAV